MHRVRIMDSTNGASEAAPRNLSRSALEIPASLPQDERRFSSSAPVLACPSLNRVYESPWKNRNLLPPQVPAPRRCRAVTFLKRWSAQKLKHYVSIVSSPADLQPTLMARKPQRSINPPTPFCKGGQGDFVPTFQKLIQIDHPASGGARRFSAGRARL